MKKNLFVFVSAFVISVNVSAQGSPDKAYSRHSNNITIGYGIGNVWKTFLNKVIEIPEYKVASTGPFTLIYEYGVSNRISAGLIGSYSRVNGKAERYQLADQITILSLLARADYHFCTSRKFDPYIGGGAGINSSKYENKDNHTIIDNPNSKVPGSFDYSAQLGIKYFPCKHLGLYIEAGYVGGSFVQAGITGKF